MRIALWLNWSGLDEEEAAILGLHRAQGLGFRLCRVHRGFKGGGVCMGDCRMHEVYRVYGVSRV